eukprot:6619264-Pyramimonas_sp.AAC.1
MEEGVDGDAGGYTTSNDVPDMHGPPHRQRCIATYAAVRGQTSGGRSDALGCGARDERHLYNTLRGSLVPSILCAVDNHDEPRSESVLRGAHLAGGVDLRLRLLGLDHLLLDLNGCRLGGGKGIDELLVVQNIPGGGGHEEQNAVLD